MTKSHGIGGGPKNAFFGPPAAKMEKKPYFTGLLVPFRMSRGGNSDEGNSEFKNG